ncbi:MAG: GxxExxY protein [Bacteroidota bacterium]|nr:GxxExxY protein [Bacteroidota bacterium]
MRLRRTSSTKAIVNAVRLRRIHKTLGPGLLEKVYEVCFCHVLNKLGYNIKRQLDIPIMFEGIVFDEGLRLDVMVNDLVICELKALETVNPVWEAQLLSHFNVPLIKDGIKRIIL